MNMTLRQFIEKKEFYCGQIYLKKYKHNIKVLNSVDGINISEFKKFINTSLIELFEAYINSEKFNNNEINRIKKKYDDWYVNRYIYLSKNYLT